MYYFVKLFWKFIIYFVKFVRFFSVAQVKAKSFTHNQQIPIRFSMFDLSGTGKDKKPDAFSMDDETGVVNLLKKLDYDDPYEPRLYKLKGN